MVRVSPRGLSAAFSSTSGGKACQGGREGGGLSVLERECGTFNYNRNVRNAKTSCVCLFSSKKFDTKFIEIFSFRFLANAIYGEKRDERKLGCDAI